MRVRNWGGMLLLRLQLPPWYPCRCSHVYQLHYHYRAGTECSVCGCQRWRPVGTWHEVVLWGVIMPFALFGLLMFVLMVVSLLTRAGTGG